MRLVNAERRAKVFAEMSRRGETCPKWDEKPDDLNLGIRIRYNNNV